MRGLRARRHEAAWTRCLGPGQAAQSPMREDVVVARRLQRRRTDELVDAVGSSPAMSFMKSGALTPAAHTTSSAGSMRPSARRTPSGSTSATLAVVCTSTPSLRSSASVACDRRGGSAGSTRSAASIT